MKIDVSVGEVVDKATILYIKKDKIKNSEKLKNIEYEYALLHSSMAEVGITTASAEFRDLLSINLSLWEIEDKIRIKEKQKSFDMEFVKLARSVYLNNDQRAEVKKRINLKFGSDLVEEKEYVDYTAPDGD